MLKVIARMEVVPGKCDFFIKNLAELALKAERCKGCCAYEPVMSREEKNVFFIIEEWVNDEFFKAHFEESFMKDFERNCKEALLAEVKVSVCDGIM